MAFKAEHVESDMYVVAPPSTRMPLNPKKAAEKAVESGLPIFGSWDMAEKFSDGLEARAGILSVILPIKSTVVRIVYVSEKEDGRETALRGAWFNSKIEAAKCVGTLNGFLAAKSTGSTGPMQPFKRP